MASTLKVISDALSFAKLPNNHFMKWVYHHIIIVSLKVKFEILWNTLLSLIKKETAI